jgi:hypothetical protein
MAIPGKMKRPFPIVLGLGQNRSITPRQFAAVLDVTLEQEPKIGPAG